MSDNIENKPAAATPAVTPAPAAPTAPEPGPASAEASLRGQINFLVMVMILLCCAVAAFMWRQASYMKRDLGAARQPANEVIQRFRQEAPMVDAFVAKVAEYSRTHPDFAPIAQKYGLQNFTNAPAAPKPALPGTPAPK